MLKWQQYAHSLREHFFEILYVFIKLLQKMYNDFLAPVSPGHSRLAVPVLDLFFLGVFRRISAIRSGYYLRAKRLTRDYLNRASRFCTFFLDFSEKCTVNHKSPI